MNHIITVLVSFTALIASLFDPIKGVYMVEYNQTSSNKKQVVLINFSDTTYEKTYKNGEKVAGSITRWYDKDKKEKWVRLVDHHFDQPKGNLDSLIQKSFGVPIIEFVDSGRDTILFRSTYSKNLHITLDDGIIIRKRSE